MGPIRTIPLEEQNTVNAEWCTSICLPNVLEKVREKRPRIRVLLHYDNASPHTANKTISFLTFERYIHAYSFESSLKLNLLRPASSIRPFSHPFSFILPAALEIVRSGGSHGVVFSKLGAAARSDVISLTVGVVGGPHRLGPGWQMPPQLYNQSQTGLLRDDCLYETEDVQEALRRIPSHVVDERNFRLVRAMQLSLQKSILPKDQWTKFEEDELYLTPMVEQVKKERLEKEEWEKNY
ncbi:Cytochrome b-c1 complex subunit 7 [Eumeta japonica]|uniref:Cytochrome b-c1 complex subunit 7 n=1 Tax=Eumeta variegata TaxID=151549 RepID=A0A4C1TBV6_EUMVA|nr:Cytochrome b-c1 complex subunit 7 [Eumeta japonica]